MRTRALALSPVVGAMPPNLLTSGVGSATSIWLVERKLDLGAHTAALE